MSLRDRAGSRLPRSSRRIDLSSQMAHYGSSLHTSFSDLRTGTTENLINKVVTIAYC
jgi:hypothetical protein